MLEALRKSASGLVAKLLIGLLVLSFAVWGVADIFSGYRGTDVAQVGQTPITIEEYRAGLQREIQQMSQQVGSYLTMDQARAIGLDARVLSRLMSQAALDDEVRQRGLGVSNVVVADDIRNDPTFQTPGGQFDQTYFAQVLRSSGYSEGLYISEQRKQLLRQMIVDAVGGDQPVPLVLQKAINRFQGETRSAEYIVVTPAMVGDAPEPTEEELRTYYDDNTAEFRAPEYRKVGIVSLEAANLVASVQISDDDLRAHYDANRDEYGTPERRAVERIVFETLDAARQARQEIEDGKTFEEIAAAQGLNEDDRKLGTLTRDGVLDPAIAESAFALDLGQISEPVQGGFGPVLVRVTEIDPGATMTFDQVREDIRIELALRQSADSVLDVYDSVEDDRAAGLTLTEISQKQGLPYTEIAAIDRQGRDLEGNPVRGLPGANRLIGEVFTMNVGVEADPLQTATDGWAWFDVLDIIASRDVSFEEARDKVAAAWRAEQTRDLVQTKTKQVVDKIRAGTDFFTMAEELGVTSGLIGPITRNSTDGAFGEAAVQLLFTTAQGGVTSTVSAEAPKRVVFRVTGITEPLFQNGLSESITAQIETGISNDILGQYLKQLQERIGSSVNQEALRLALGDTQP